MNKDDMISVLRELHRVTGFRISLHDADHTEIAAYPQQKRRLCALIHSVPGEYELCRKCDSDACAKAMAGRKTYTYTCRHGLTEAVSPLYNFGTLSGFLMMGQVYREGQPKTMPNLNIKRTDELYGELREAVKQIPTVSPEMIRSYSIIMTICAQYLTLSNAMTQERPTTAELARRYIGENYTAKITIKDICAEVGCSKSTLITAFKTEFGSTINEYINELRLNDAALMLRTGEKSIGEIAVLCGFSDQSYFSKVFSARYEVSPSEYRAAKDNEIQIRCKTNDKEGGQAPR